MSSKQYQFSLQVMLWNKLSLYSVLYYNLKIYIDKDKYQYYLSRLPHVMCNNVSADIPCILERLLTKSVWWISTPASISILTTSAWPPPAAWLRALLPSYYYVSNIPVTLLKTCCYRQHTHVLPCKITSI